MLNYDQGLFLIILLILISLMLFLLSLFFIIKDRNIRLVAVMVSTVLAISLIILALSTKTKSEAYSLLEDIENTKNISISESDAIRIVKERRKSSNSGYNDIIVSDVGNKNRLYSVLYRIEDGKVYFYMEEEDGVYLLLR